MKRLLWVLGIVVVLGVVVQLVADPIAAHYTRRALQEQRGMRGTFA